MISIILTASPEVIQDAKADGFVERKVLVKHHGCKSTEENKSELEKQLRKLGPYQFLVSDFWGMAPR